MERREDSPHDPVRWGGRPRRFQPKTPRWMGRVGTVDWSNQKNWNAQEVPHSGDEIQIPFSDPHTTPSAFGPWWFHAKRLTLGGVGTSGVNPSRGGVRLERGIAGRNRYAPLRRERITSATDNDEHDMAASAGLPTGGPAQQPHVDGAAAGH